MKFKKKVFYWFFGIIMKLFFVFCVVGIIVFVYKILVSFMIICVLDVSNKIVV